jgi:hypothetical protein
MRAAHRYLGFLFLSAALTIPVAVSTSAATQDEHRNDKRVYDRSHKDYHNWDDNEDHAYRRYLGEKHQDYREYSKLNRSEQNSYWGWRHSHPDGH